MHLVVTRCCLGMALIMVATPLAGAFAADEPVTPVAAQTVAREKEVTRGLLKDERFSFKPQVGVLSFTDSQGSTTGRAAYGLTIDFNLLTLVNLGRQELGATPWFMGPAFGLIASHLGDPSSNLFGSNAGAGAGQAGSNLLILPLTIKGGYAFTDFYRLSLHGGGNLVYRSIASSTNLGSDSNTTDSQWKLYPSLGADLDIALSRKVALLLRPDWTMAPENSLFTGTVGIGIFVN